MPRYIHQTAAWPAFSWNSKDIEFLLSGIRYRQGKLIGWMEALGFNLRNEAMLETITLDVLKSSEIEGEMLNMQQVRSSVAKRLGLKIAGMVHADRHVEGVVEMMLDATQRAIEPLTKDRLFGWHAAMFPTGHSGLYKITTGKWRKDAVQVVSGAMGRERVHFEGPDAALVEREMKQFMQWFNGMHDVDAVLKAGIAHFWFVTVHPFDDGNGRIARAIADMQLARADGTSQRFYSMSAQIMADRKNYYQVLEKCQRGTVDITAWVVWFLRCLDRALYATEETLSMVIQKAKFWETHAKKAFNPRQKKMLNKLMDGFDGKLVSSKWAKMAKCSHDTALRDIQELIDMKILAKEKAGGRSTSYRLRI
jgi:Fic family protein